MDYPGHVTHIYTYTMYNATSPLAPVSVNHTTTVCVFIVNDEFA